MIYKLFVSTTRHNTFVRVIIIRSIMLLICPLLRFIAIILISQIITTYANPCLKLSYDAFQAITEDSYKERVKVFQYANINNINYERAYRAYKKAYERAYRADKNISVNQGKNMQLLSYSALDKNALDRVNTFGTVLNGCDPSTAKCLYFPIEPFSTEDLKMQTFTIDHASLRFLLNGDLYSSFTSIQIYQRLENNTRMPLYSNEPIILVKSSESRWLEYNITETAMLWLNDKKTNLGLEIFFYSNNEPYYHRDISDVKLNIFIRLKPNQSTAELEKETNSEQTTSLVYRVADCSSRLKNAGICCREKFVFMFESLAVYDFVVYPKGYTSGDCIGSCSLIRNYLTHHFALTQGLIKDEPKCKSSKSNPLIVLYYDQNDSSILKLGYWKETILLECDCQ